jgi:phosphohistidine phosphatase SixA
MRKSIQLIIFLFSFSLLSYVGATASEPLKTNSYELTETEASDVFWANEIAKGGYILHFRHAEREWWIDVTAFDAVELKDKANGEKTSYASAVCLTNRGKEESKVIGKVFAYNKVKISQVISSPSCRARQTASLAFGRIDAVDNSLLHRSAIMKSQREEFDTQLRDLLLSVKIKSGTNVALVGHANTLVYDGNTVLDREENVALSPSEKNDQYGNPIPNVKLIDVESRNPTGFVVLKRIGGKIYVKHMYNSIKDYSVASVRLSVK